MLQLDDRNCRTVRVVNQTADKQTAQQSDYLLQAYNLLEKSMSSADAHVLCQIQLFDGEIQNLR